MASSLNNPAWVEWMSTLMDGVSASGESMPAKSREEASRQAYAATLPPDRYFCLLDDPPLHLLTPRSRQALHFRASAQQLVVNPDCVFCTSDRVPDDDLRDQTELLAHFALQGTIAWVKQPGHEMRLPFWLTPQLAAALGRLRAEVALSDVSPEVIGALRSAGILLPADQVDGPPHDDIRSTERSRMLFRERGYAPLVDLIHPFHIAALRRYYRFMIRSRKIPLGDGQCPRRYAAYNEPVAQFFHHLLAPVLSAIAGEPLRPSYVYFASYLSGAELKKHVDRKQCEFSLTLCLDFSPEPALETPWPIHLETQTGNVTVYQGLGDGLMYRGTKLPHSRSVLSEGQSSTSIFFHYVAADFQGSLD